MTYIPVSQPILDRDIRVSGDVEIHPTASLAPGVILQAAPDSKIIVGAEVCIGMGAIVNACGGIIEIESGAIIGSGVLIIGVSKIGNSSCIGTSTTIFQENIAPMTVIEPGSIVGDSSRQVALEEKEQKPTQDVAPAKKSAAKPQSNGRVVNGSYFSSAPNPTPNYSSEPINSAASIPKVEVDRVDVTIQKPREPVVGQLYINELLITLFPHRKNSPETK